MAKRAGIGWSRRIDEYMISDGILDWISSSENWECRFFFAMRLPPVMCTMISHPVGDNDILSTKVLVSLKQYCKNSGPYGSSVCISGVYMTYHLRYASCKIFVDKWRAAACFYLMHRGGSKWSYDDDPHPRQSLGCNWVAAAARFLKTAWNIIQLVEGMIFISYKMLVHHSTTATNW